MKPTVFLSHSKADREFIEQVANDLRTARITVWYDEWEIPAGESFRKKIFEDGIPLSDVFFVYLSPAAVSSYWVTKEFDAAFIQEAGSRGIGLATFVSDESVRSTLSLDVQSLHSPVLNSHTYKQPMFNLISRIWEVMIRNSLRKSDESHRTKILELEKNNVELENRLLRLKSIGSVDLERAEKMLDQEKITFDGIELSLLELFQIVMTGLAAGTSSNGMSHTIAQHFDGPLNTGTSYLFRFPMAEPVGLLVINGLVSMRPADEHNYETYFLTDLGILLARELMMRRKA